MNRFVQAIRKENKLFLSTLDFIRDAEMELFNDISSSIYFGVKKQATTAKEFIEEYDEEIKGVEIGYKEMYELKELFKLYVLYSFNNGEKFKKLISQKNKFEELVYYCELYAQAYTLEVLTERYKDALFEDFKEYQEKKGGGTKYMGIEDNEIGEHDD